MAYETIDEEMWELLSKDPKYPCATCETRGGKSCDRMCQDWKSWALGAWKTIREVGGISDKD